MRKVMPHVCEEIRSTVLGDGYVSDARMDRRDDGEAMMIWIKWGGGPISGGWYWCDDPHLRISVLALERLRRSCCG